MAGKKEREIMQQIKELEQNIELVDTPDIKQKVLEHKLETKAKQRDMEIV